MHSRSRYKELKERLLEPANHSALVGYLWCLIGFGTDAMPGSSIQNNVERLLGYSPRFGGDILL